jgi:hypothetical protein
MQDSRLVEQHKIDMQDKSDTQTGNPEINTKEEDKAQRMKQGTTRNRPHRQKKHIQQTNVNYDYNISKKRPLPNKDKDKDEVQYGVVMPYQPYYDESTSQGTTLYEFI